MKSFAALVLAASAALTSAQVISNPDGTFTCPIPNAAYCAGDSLSTNIIIRCIGTVGQPGNCNDNLDAEPPFGVNFSPCWQPSATSGMAACSKNCIVYGGSGNYNGTFTLPNCTPSTTVTTATTSTVSTSTVSSASGSSSAASSATASTSAPVTSYTTIVTQGTTITVPCPSTTPVTTPVTTPSGTAPTTLISSATVPTGGASVPAGNGTATASTPFTPGGSATATPVRPTTSQPASFTGAAVANQAGVVLAAGGLLMAYFL